MCANNGNFIFSKKSIFLGQFFFHFGSFCKCKQLVSLSLYYFYRYQVGPYMYQLVIVIFLFLSFITYRIPSIGPHLCFGVCRYVLEDRSWDISLLGNRDNSFGWILFFSTLLEKHVYDYWLAWLPFPSSYVVSYVAVFVYF